MCYKGTSLNLFYLTVNFVLSRNHSIYFILENCMSWYTRFCYVSLVWSLKMHAQLFDGAGGLTFALSIRLCPLYVWEMKSDKTARSRRLNLLIYVIGTKISWTDSYYNFSYPVKSVFTIMDHAKQNICLKPFWNCVVFFLPVILWIQYKVQ